jgi:hypothetical protein
MIVNMYVHNKVTWIESISSTSLSPPGKGKHRRILARLQTAQSVGPQPEAPASIATGSERTRHHHCRPVQPFCEPWRTACTPSYNLATLHTACRPCPSPLLHPRSCSSSLPSTPTKILSRSLPLTCPLICIAPDTISAVLTRLRHGTTPGLTGWTYEDILDATRRTSARRDWVSFLTKRSPAAYRMSPSSWKATASLSAHLRGASGLSPSAEPGCGSPHCAVHKCNHLGPSLAPVQLGMSISGGCRRCRPYHPLSPPLAPRPSTPVPGLPSTVFRARRSSTQLRNTPSLSYLSSPGRTAARGCISSERRHTTPPPTSPPAACSREPRSTPSCSP